ncbi:MAG TPA: phosphate ABC transporter substrate-binding protein PstS family protein [Verrucomicrobiae bacterium]
MKRTLWALALLLAGQFAAVVAGEVTIKGSDTMVILAQRWAETFMKQTSGVNIQVTGGGSGTGIAALRNNSTDIATASRAMKPKEMADLIATHGAKPLEIKTSLDGLSVYVHASNPMKEISFAQLDRIFRGQARNWSEFGGPDKPIVIYSRENNSGTYAYFKEHVLKEQDFSARALTMVGTAALINAVSKDPGAIGYGGIGYASGVKSLMVKEKDTDEACLPTDENVISGKYPLSRYLFFYLMPGGMSGDVKKFVDWVVTPAGQEVVTAAGYIPLPAAKPAPAVAVATTAPAMVAKAPVAVASQPVSAFVPAQAVAAPSPQTVQPVVAQVQPMAAQPVPQQHVYQQPQAYVAQPAYNPTSAIESLLEQSAALGKREAMMAGREESFASREAKLADREARLVGKESEVGVREAGLVSKEKELTAKEKELMRIEDELNKGRRDSNRSNLFRR